jgi:hypothetical protein
MIVRENSGEMRTLRGGVRRGMTGMELLNEPHELREMATRVRRLAKGLPQNAAQERMLRHAMELEADAGSLERHAAEVPLVTST